MNWRILLLIAFASCWIPAAAQNTVGVLSHIEASTQPGFNLAFPHNQNAVWLFDNCGRVVNKWVGAADERPGNTAYIQENGNIYIAHRPAAVGGDVIWAGGGGATIDLRDWNNNVLNTVTLNDSFYRLHHDIAPMPNGNVLAVVWERFTKAEAWQLGRDTSNMTEEDLWSEAVFEYSPNGSGGFDVAWEWHLDDHLVQDYDSMAPNFGDPALHPELMDANYLGVSNGVADWLHINSIDYNPGLDQILLSVPTISEIWILDHSTTTAQAAAHAGGLAGRGGDIIFRWGNPEAHDQGDSTDQQLAYQHDAHWIDAFLPAGSPDYGKIMVFNNRIGPDYSELAIIEPQFNTYDWEYVMIGGGYAPGTFDWVYQAPVPQDMYSDILSGGQRLANGNTLVTVGRSGYSFELDGNQDIVWEWKNPVVQGTPASQGDILALSSNLNFRLYRYPNDFPGFAGRGLVAGDYIEMNPDTTQCNLPAVGQLEPELASLEAMYPNPAQGFVTLERSTARPGTVVLYDQVGRMVRTFEVRGVLNTLDLNGVEPGFYLLELDGIHAGKLLIAR